MLPSIYISAYLPSKISMHRRRRAELHVRAEVVSALLAEVAHPAADAGLDGNTVARLQVSHGLAAPCKKIVVL